jgi:glycosyltransferase involved in cell wall biosynthesis
MDQAGWKVLKTSVYKNKFLRLINMLYTIYSKRRVYQVAEIDVFSGAAFIFAELSSFLLSCLKKPFVLNLRGGSLPDFSRRHTKRVSRVLASADKVVCPSSYLQKRLIHIRADIQVIPNPITINNHKFVLRFNAKPNLIWIRAFHKIYNPSLAPQVLKKLIHFRPNAHLIMIGPDKGDGALQRMLLEAESLDVESYLELPGRIDRCQVPSWLEKSDIFINTTNVDNTPVSVIEAMASGCCIVTTNVGGIPYLLEDGIDALLVPPNDPDAMANAVLRVLTESGLAEKLSINARRKAEKFDWSIVLPQWEEVFEKVINN